MSATRTFTLTFVGDVMLGRLIDQLYPTHVNNPLDQRIAARFIKDYPHLLGHDHYTPSSPWGTTLPLLRTSDLTLINLETSATTTCEPWPDKTFNYRMHPANLAPILHAAHVDYASLANNHTLDFGADGLVETVWTLRDAGITFAGAGAATDEAYKPAVLWLPRSVQEYHARHVDGQKVSGQTQPERGYAVHVYSASDHPREWGVVPTFHLIDYSPATRARLRTLLCSDGARSHPHPPAQAEGESETFHHREHHHHPLPTSTYPAPALKVFSVHWGPNYSWRPADRIRSLAHFLIDECGVDIVHGHSSHHVQGVERYHGKIIIYGCGDFVDDYAFHADYRNDLGAVWRVLVKERGGGNDGTLVLDRLEIFPTRIDRFRALLLDVHGEDHGWVRSKIGELSRDFGTNVRKEVGEQGQIVVDLDG